jgi:hypothetical protein
MFGVQLENKIKSIFFDKYVKSSVRAMLFTNLIRRFILNKYIYIYIYIYINKLFTITENPKTNEIGNRDDIFYKDDPEQLSIAQRIYSIHGRWIRFYLIL